MVASLEPEAPLPEHRAMKVPDRKHQPKKAGIEEEIVREIVTVIIAATGLAALIMQGNSGLRDDIAAFRTEVRADIGQINDRLRIL